MSSIAFTVCNYNYIDRALALAESYLDKTGQKLRIVVIDRKRPIPDLPAEVLFIEDLEVPNFSQLAFRYDIIELSTAVKPWLARRFLVEAEEVLFFDPDTYIIGDLSPIHNELAGCNVLLTSHYLAPQPSSPEESDLAMMRFGSYNLGFFAVKRNEDTFHFLDWWWSRCREYCFMESQFGLSTDQKWITIAPCLFDGLRLSRNKGLNIAPWNSFERRLSLQDGNFFVGSSPAVFYHFSNFDERDLDYKNKRSSIEAADSDLALTELATAYLSHFRRHSHLKRSYGFDYDSKGRYISPTFRRAYSCIRSSFDDGVSPFESELVASFGSRNGLFQRDNQRYQLVGFRSLKGQPISMRLFTMTLRVLLRTVGPNRFFDFCRLMVNRTLLWKNKDMWRY